MRLLEPLTALWLWLLLLPLCLVGRGLLFVLLVVAAMAALAAALRMHLLKACKLRLCDVIYSCCFDRDEPAWP